MYHLFFDGAVIQHVTSKNKNHAKKKKTLKTTNTKMWWRGREDPLEQACQLEAGVCRVLLSLEASFCSIRPFPVRAATRGGLSLVCGVG